MNKLLLLYNFFVIATATASLASLMPALYLFKVAQRALNQRERRLLLYFAAFCFAAAYEAGNTALTMGLVPSGRTANGWIVALRMSGRLLETLAAVVLTLRLSGLINGHKPHIGDA